MDPYLYLIIVIFYTYLIIQTIVVLRAKQIWRWSSVCYLVVLALIYDNLILACGRLIGEGSALYNLHIVSHWLHVILTPTLVIFCFSALKQAKIPWAQQRFFIPIGIVLSIVLSIWEGLRTLVNLKLKPVETCGTISYTSIEHTNHLFGMISVIMLVLIVTSILLWVYCKYNLLFWGIVLMSMVMGIGQFIPSKAFSNLGELVLLAAILVTKKKLDMGQVYVGRY